MDRELLHSSSAPQQSTVARKRSFQEEFGEDELDCPTKRTCRIEQDLHTDIHYPPSPPLATDQVESSRAKQWLEEQEKAVRRITRDTRASSAPLHLSSRTVKSNWVRQWVEEQEQVTRGITRNRRASSAPPAMNSFATSFTSDTESLPESTIYGRPSSSVTSRSQSTARHQKQEKQDLQDYRDFNLADNGVHLKSLYDERPDRVTTLIEQMKKPRELPLPDFDRKELEKLETRFPVEEDVLQALGSSELDMLPRKTTCSGEKVERISKTAFSHQNVPSLPKGVRGRIATPAPDYCWGFSKRLLPREPITTHLPPCASKKGRGVTAPFLVAEVKSDTGSLAEALNQCLGGAASCVKIAEAIKAALLAYHPRVDFETTCFAIAMCGTEARWYVCWLHNPGASLLEYHMQRVQTFSIQQPTQFLELRNIIHNIIDWGATTRFDTLNHYMTDATLPVTSQKRKADDAMPPPAERS